MNKRSREYNQKHYTSHVKDNPECPTYLGCYVAERVLANVFKNVDVMPYGNPGFDFVCDRGYKIDVKSSCRHVSTVRSDNWRFAINHNTTADQFLLLTFDNRADLNPEYCWLIPGDLVNMKYNISISESRIHKWDQYKIDKLDDIVECCNTLKQKKNNGGLP